MKQIARLHYLKVAPRKVRSVADLIKGLSVNEAEAQLLLLRQRAAKPILKLLRSAIANAKSSKRLDVNRLAIESLRVDQGPMLKRMLPRARGMATPIQKKMSHITLTLVEMESAPAPRFTILPPPKKSKTPAATKAKDKKKEVEKERFIPQKKAGFLRRMFSRKAV